MIEEVRFTGMETREYLGEEIKAGDRVIIPVMRLSTLRTLEKKIVAAQIMPLAMIIVEPAGRYAISLDGKAMTLEAILQMAPSLRESLKKVMQ